MRLLLAILAAATLAAAAFAPMPMRPVVQVKVRGVTLSDLLPHAGIGLAPAPGPVLAAAPLPGTSRRWQRSEIEAALRAAGDDPAAFNIPESILLVAAMPALPREVVWHAVEAWFAAHPAWQPANGAERNLVYPQVAGDGDAVCGGDAHFDALHNRLVLTCQLAAEPDMLPFAVQVPVAHAPTPSPTALAMPAANRVWLVEPGKPVHLILSTSGYELDATGVPLQRGALGDRIRVVSDLNHSTLQAEVIGANQVRVLAEPAFHAPN